MPCNAPLYAGTEPKAVLIHAKKDDAVVFPLIERLSRLGLRIWHDSEIREVMVDYSHSWKTQQADCDCFIVFLSQNAVNSHVFRERFTNAVETSKPFVVISTITSYELSPGMKLQVNRNAKLFNSGYIPQETLAEEIAALDVLKPCMGAQNPDVNPRPYPSGSVKQEEPPLPSKPREFGPSERTILEMRGGEPATPPMRGGEPATPPDDPGEATISNKKVEIPEAEAPIEELKNVNLEETLKLTDKLEIEVEDLEKTFIPQRIMLPVLVCLTSAEKTRGMLGETVVGRTKKMQGAMADISFADSCKLFSGKHFQLIYIDNLCMLVCKHPNGMNVNGVDLKENDKYTVESEAVIQIPSNITLAQLEDKNVRPAFIAVGVKEKAQEYWDTNALAFLQSSKTGEIRCFTTNFKFGRNNAWKTNAMASRYIGRNHGDITLDGDHYCFEDHSENGTIINEKSIKDEKAVLSDGDVISIQGYSTVEERFIFHCCFLERS